MRPTRFWTIAFAILFAGVPASAQVVYQDNFDNDGNAGNVGVGGGFNGGSNGGISFVDNGDLSAGNATSGANRTNFSSINSFDLSSGFTLEVTYTQASNVAGASPPFPSNHFSLGLSTASATGTEEFYSTGSAAPAFDGLGVSLGLRSSNVTEGLLQANLNDSYTILDDFNLDGDGNPVTQAETFGPNAITLSLTVDSNGAYDYTLGGLSGSGTTSLNLNQEFFFRGRTQGSAGNTVQSVTLTLLTEAEPTPIDVYFIIGQSNAGNFGEINSYDVEGYPAGGINGSSFDEQTDAGFRLNFGRIPDRPSGGTVDEFIEDFSETFLDPTNYAVDNMAVILNDAFGNDIGIYSYGRNGRPLANLDNSADDGLSWFPGTVADPFNDELYGAFLDWSAIRLQDLENGSDGIAGTGDDRTVNVQGAFWFQGEADASSGVADQYQDNFENLVARLRNDFDNPGLAVVASEIREVNANNAARLEVNAALNAVAAADDNVSVIDISDASIYVPINAQNVHLATAGHYAMSFDVAEELIEMTTMKTLIGDVNRDDVVNLLDVGPFVELLNSGSFQLEADINQDGVVNLLDVGPFVDILTDG